ncbi:MAG TPA: ABC transporter permease [Planctomycetota bacterium]|nr:ABC transporter permease [Planctomycetota bacterium]
MLIPFRYNLRHVVVRRTGTLLTALGIAATVAIFAGVLALEAGFRSLFEQSGRDDLFVFLRPGAASEGESACPRTLADRLIKTLPEIQRDDQGAPLASMELYLAVLRHRVGGGQTNVPVRGLEQRSFDIYGDSVRIVEGRRFRPGTDEVIVGSKTVDRIRGCHVGDVIQLNTTPFSVVGVFESDGPFTSEIWGDLDRMLATLARPDPSRIIAQMRPGTDVEEIARRLEHDKETPAAVFTERAYFAAQTSALSNVLRILGFFLAVVMGTAAVFTAANTMLAAIASRTHEIGILLACGFRPMAIFLAFLGEALVLGLIGGALGCLIVVPLNGLETGATNFNTFTEVAFAFRVTPDVLLNAVVFSLVLGLLGGAAPAWRAARLPPVTALRRQ